MASIRSRLQTAERELEEAKAINAHNLSEAKLLETLYQTAERERDEARAEIEGAHKTLDVRDVPRTTWQPYGGGEVTLSLAGRISTMWTLETPEARLLVAYRVEHDGDIWQFPPEDVSVVYLPTSQKGNEVDP